MPIRDTCPVQPRVCANGTCSSRDLSYLLEHVGGRDSDRGIVPARNGQSDLRLHLVHSCHRTIRN